MIHIISVVLITGSIILVGAIVLHPTGTEELHSACSIGGNASSDHGKCSEVYYGSGAVRRRILFFIRNTQRGMVLLSAGFDKRYRTGVKSNPSGCLITPDRDDDHLL